MVLRFPDPVSINRYRRPRDPSATHGIRQRVLRRHPRRAGALTHVSRSQRSHPLRQWAFRLVAEPRPPWRQGRIDTSGLLPHARLEYCLLLALCRPPLHGRFRAPGSHRSCARYEQIDVRCVRGQPILYQEKAAGSSGWWRVACCYQCRGARRVADAAAGPALRTRALRPRPAERGMAFMSGQAAARPVPRIHQRHRAGRGKREHRG